MCYLSLFFDNVILVNELFEKILRELKTCLLDNNDFCVVQLLDQHRGFVICLDLL